MITVIVLTFLAGLMGTNGIPHFVQGITAREYPNLTGNSPTNNVIGGLAAFGIAGALVAVAKVDDHPHAAWIAAAVGAVAMAVFHAQRGAYLMSRLFGRPIPVG